MAAKQFVVSNPGQTAVPLAGVALSGAGADQFAIGANTCTGSLGPGATCTVGVAATVTREGSMSATLGALGTGGQAAQATLADPRHSVPVVFTPTLKMNPGVVSPGEVTAAIGAGFPPNIEVELAFAGEAPFAKVQVKDDGTFRYDYLLLRNGIRIGGREIVAIDQAEFSGRARSAADRPGDLPPERFRQPGDHQWSALPGQSRRLRSPTLTNRPAPCSL